MRSLRARGHGWLTVPVLTLCALWFVGCSGKGGHDAPPPPPPPAPAPAPTITSFTPTSGGTGTSVTITGTDLTGATAVRFGGTPASSFTVASATRITATVGDGASGPIEVTTPAGTARSGETFTFTADAPPSRAGTLRVFIEDAPPKYEDLRAVRLDIGKVEALFIDNQLGMDGALPLTTTRSSVDVLPLRGGRREEIASGSVRPSPEHDGTPRDGVTGGYHIRFEILGAEVVTATGTYATHNGRLMLTGGTPTSAGGVAYVFETPGGRSDAVIVGDGEQVLATIDLDLEESLEVEGNPENPSVITLTPRGRFVGLAGNTLRGVVRSDSGTPDDPSDDVPIENAQVWFEEEPSVRRFFKRTDAQGVYELKGLGGEVLFWVHASGHDTITGDRLRVSGTETRDVVLRKNPSVP